MLIVYSFNYYSVSRDDRNVYEYETKVCVDIEDPLYPDIQVIMDKWKEQMMNESHWKIDCDGDLYGDGGNTRISNIRISDETNGFRIYPQDWSFEHPNSFDPKSLINLRKWRDEGK
ncbi:Uncharacterised protein [Lysinibacillus sphaericus]|nr:Uncharacterised protein [Lysinibacillus sphaericus]